MNVSYSNISNAVQTNLWTLISQDSTSVAFENGESQAMATMKIIDGSFPTEAKNLTFPLILVHSATPKDDYYSFTNLTSDIGLEVEVFATREKTVRLIIDRIRALLQSSQTTTRSQGVEFYKSTVTGISNSMVDNRIVHSANLIVSYRHYSTS